MTMELLLWRHCEAETGEPDLGRALTGKGEKQARRVAAWLHAHLPDSARILVSPARRAQQTAAALAELAPRKLKTIDALAPGASADDVLGAVGWPKGKTAIVVVGHQPTLGWVASRLLTGVESDWPIKKGAVWWFSARSRFGVEQAIVRAVLGPDLV
jgi:phosphohistidine phosphatase